MDNAKKKYIIYWAIVFVVFNVLAFLIPVVSGNLFTGAFWAGYIFTVLMMAVHLAVTVIAFNKGGGSVKKLYYGIPGIYISYIGLVLGMIIGAVFILVPFLPVWIAIVVLLLFTVVYAGVFLRTGMAIDVIEQVEQKVEVNTSFIRTITAKASSLQSLASDAQIKETCRKVYEALRYSDPMSNENIAQSDNAIDTKYEEFEAAVKASDTAGVEKISTELLALISERNALCKNSKKG